jgi:type IV fimbrial biogenesis protein FimT
VELLAVIVLIGIIAAAAAPSILRAMEDNRVQKATYRVAETVRFARGRALGRGSAVLVRWDVNHAAPTPDDPNGRLTVREAIQSGGLGPLPSSSCFQTDWGDNSATSRYVASFDNRAPAHKPAEIEFLDPNGTAQAVAQICFSPRGRTFVRYANNGAFAPLSGVPRFTVLNPTSSFLRQVIVPPNGVAHVVGRL